MLRPRNFIARSPLLRKGGVHQRSQSGKRQQQKQALAQEVNGIKTHDEERVGEQETES